MESFGGDLLQTVLAGNYAAIGAGSSGIGGGFVQVTPDVVLKVFRIDPSQPARFPLRLRIPRWCGSAAVTVNDRPVDRAMTAGTFLTLQRQWRAGDRVELQLPMSWRLVRGRKAQAGRVAIVRGHAEMRDELGLALDDWASRLTAEGGDISGFVHENVVAALNARFS